MFRSRSPLPPRRPRLLCSRAWREPAPHCKWLALCRCPLPSPSVVLPGDARLQSRLLRHPAQPPPMAASRRRRAPTLASHRSGCRPTGGAAPLSAAVATPAVTKETNSSAHKDTRRSADAPAPDPIADEERGVGRVLPAATTPFAAAAPAELAVGHVLRRSSRWIRRPRYCFLAGGGTVAGTGSQALLSRLPTGGAPGRTCRRWRGGTKAGVTATGAGLVEGEATALAVASLRRPAASLRRPPRWIAFLPAPPQYPPTADWV